MGKTSDKLNYLNETKQEIKQALREQKIDVKDTDTFRSYADKVRAIKGTEDLTDVLEAQDVALTELEDAVNNLPDAGGSAPAKLIEGAATQNGEYWAKDYGADGFEVFTVNVSDKTFQPQGTIEIKENGIYDVYDYETAEVNVKGGVAVNVVGAWTLDPTGGANTVNGVYYNFTTDGKIQLIALGNITDMGTYFVEENKIYLSAEGEEMIWYYNEDGGIAVEENGESMMWRLVPQGTLEVNENGDYDVTPNTKVVVQVPIPEGYLKPEGDLEITENNKQYDVTDKKTVTVNVPTGGSGERDENETMYEMQEADYMRYLQGQINIYDIPSEAEYLEQQEYVNSAIAIIMGEEF